MSSSTEMRRAARHAARRLLWRLRPYAVPLALAALVGVIGGRAVLARAGEPALPLDDSFIHLQYAKRLAQGSWFSYTPSSGYSAGATSMAWPVVLAPFFAAGLRGLQLVWVVWTLGVLLHAATALEASRLGHGLMPRWAQWATGGMCLAFGAFAWFAQSGMETMALAWVLTRGARVCADFCERRGSARQLVALSWLAPLVRPEGALVSLMATLTLLVHGRCPRAAGRPGGHRGRWLALPTLAGPLLTPAMHLVLAGRAVSNTAMVKWLPLDPYLRRSELWRQTLDNARLLATDLLDGGVWTWLFVPEHFAPLLGLGLICLPLVGWARGRGWRALWVVLLVAGTLGPCTYGTMLWNRVRYIWPFAAGWFVAVACGAAALGGAVGRLRAPLAALGPAIGWGVVALLAAKLPAAVADLAQSARAIARQQAALGRWAHDHLPLDAVIGVNDTGAIAYFSERRTFDVVGLTTAGEARYWVAGAGSRFEHYERLGRQRLPSHFIVYPGWMRVPAVLGRWLTQATVVEQTILGGKTMVAYRARYELLHSGARPFSDRRWGRLLGELDVADLESEEASGYRVGVTAGRFDVARLGAAPDGRAIADGGRMVRTTDAFRLPPLPEAWLVIRARVRQPLEILLDGARLGEARIVATDVDWEEQAISLPPSSSPREIVVRPVSARVFDSYHYWWFAR